MSMQTMWVADHVILTTTVHRHDYYQLVYCRGGKGAVEIDGIRHEAAPGVAYLVLPMQSHRLIQSDGLHLCEVKFTVPDETFDGMLRRLPAVFRIDGNASLRSVFSEVIKEGLHTDVCSRAATDSALQLFFIHVIRNHPDRFPGGTEQQFLPGGRESRCTAGKIGDEPLLRVVDYIEKHLSEPITLADLTALVHFDKSYLIVRFKEKWGIPPMKYVNWLRIERAKVLLGTTSLSITDIAEEVGFQSVHYFSRFFKEKENMTPNDYRLLRQKTTE